MVRFNFQECWRSEAIFSGPIRLTELKKKRVFFCLWRVGKHKQYIRSLVLRSNRNHRANRAYRPLLFAKRLDQDPKPSPNFRLLRYLYTGMIQHFFLHNGLIWIQNRIRKLFIPIWIHPNSFGSNSFYSKTRSTTIPGRAGSVCFWTSLIRIHQYEVRIRILLLSSKNSKTTVLWLLYGFLSFKNDVNVTSKSNKPKKLLKKLF